MIDVVVCDDEKYERDRIKDLICQYSIAKNMEINVYEFSSGEALLDTYEKGKYDMIFLDIEMGKSDGIEVADQIRRVPDHDVMIMYVTNYPEYMQQSFDVRAAQFFSKPLKYEVFESKMDKIFEYMSYEEDKKIAFGNNNEKVLISLSDICTIETVKSIKSNSDLLVTTTNGQLNVKGKLKDYAEKYGEPLHFAHRSVLVNVQNVFKWMGEKIIMKNGREIRISRDRLSELKTVFTESVLRRIGR